MGGRNQSFIVPQPWASGRFANLGPRFTTLEMWCPERGCGFESRALR